MLTWHSFPILLASLSPLAITAPVPRETDAARLQRIYGTWSDPNRDSTFAMKGNELHISLPAGERLLIPGREDVKDNAPRVLREVEGDFTAIVRVTFPAPERIPKASWTYSSGGLLAWESDKAHLVIRRELWQRQWPPGSDLDPPHYSDCQHGLGSGPWRASRVGLLALRREGSKVIVGWSRDGRAWKDSGALDVDWGARVKVGVVAENSLGVPIQIKFDQYSLTQPKK